jgi:hypothetical protein
LTSLGLKKHERRPEMSTTTIEERLAEIRDRIDRLRARERDAAPAEKTRLGRHLDVLQHEEALAREAVRRAPEDVDERIAQLSTRLEVAEHSLAADASDDWAGFAAAVEAELRSWDIYLERLQTSVAANAWKAREQAESAIGAVRSRRIQVDEHLVEARAAAAVDTTRARERVIAARDELEQKADELSAKVK